VKRLLCAALLVGIGVSAFLFSRSTVAQNAVVDDRKIQPVATDRKADQQAIEKRIDELLSAFNKGDSKKLVALFTPEGEYIADDGTALRGRAAIEKAYMGFFEKNPEQSITHEAESLRFLASGTAVLETYFKVSKGKGTELVVSKCSLLFVKEQNEWQIALLREWTQSGIALRDIEWLIGTWTSKGEDVVATTTYSWEPSKKFIRVEFTIQEKERLLKGTQVIAHDPTTTNLRSWTFEDEGGFGEAEWTRDGKKWLQDARGTLPDGRVLTALNIITPIGADSFTFQSVNRELDGEEIADLPPIKVFRVKTKN